MTLCKVGIVGGTGYTGVELLRFLLVHEHVEVAAVTSRSEKGVRLADYFPSLRGLTDLEFSDPEAGALSDCDIIFFATPHTVAASQVAPLLKAGKRIIDLSADFRLGSKEVWEHWYSVKHPAPELLDQAVYGLPEFNRERIRDAALIACPGCYPTAVLLGLHPLLKGDDFDLQSVIVDAKTGVSGAGRGASVGMLFSETAENFKAYGASGHRHLPEILEHASIASLGRSIGLTFVPHLVPMMRGMETTLYIRSSGRGRSSTPSLESVYELYSDSYRDEPFVDVMPLGSHPETRSVKGTNLCRIGLFRQTEDGPLIVSSVIDNLGKGAAGQAIQNMNILLGLDETSGLLNAPLLPG